MSVFRPEAENTKDDNSDSRSESINTKPIPPKYRRMYISSKKRT